MSFTDFYRQERAIFQAGELYLDGRRCSLCIKVDDIGAHAKLAALSKTYLAYCECSRPSTGEKMTIAAAFTNGDAEDLMVGRNGLFYDRHGKDWDATIVRIIDNPISIGEAFWSPYRKAGRFIEEMIAKRAEAADKAATGKLTAAAESAGKSAESGKAPDKPKFEVGTVAALGVAVGGLTAAFSAVLGAFMGLGPWIPVGIVGVIIAISGPSMVIAWLKLRQRSLGPILEGNGWAVNGKVRLNIPLGAALTDVAELPDGAERTLTDPYVKETHYVRNFFITLLVLLLLAFGVGTGLHYGGVIDGPELLRSWKDKVVTYVTGGGEEDAAADGAAEEGSADGGAASEETPAEGTPAEGTPDDGG